MHWKDVFAKLDLRGGDDAPLARSRDDLEDITVLRPRVAQVHAHFGLRCQLAVAVSVRRFDVGETKWNTKVSDAPPTLAVVDGVLDVSSLLVRVRPVGTRIEVIRVHITEAAKEELPC